MPAFHVTKVVWEHGEKYGHVFMPQDMQGLKEKIEQFHNEGLNKNYPFQVEISFDDPQFYVSFTVGHEYSCMMFAYAIDNNTVEGPFYVVNPAGREEEIIPIYLFASYTEPDTRTMLPYTKVREAVFHFAETYLFPLSIRFDDDIVNGRFIQS